MKMSSQGATKKPPLKVYIMAGQSNMLGHAHIKTLPYVGMDPETVPLLEKVRVTNPATADSSSSSKTTTTTSTTFKTYENIWISQKGRGNERHGNLSVGYGADEKKIGPELMFGITMMEQQLAQVDQDQQEEEEILIIKTAWGGKSLHTDFRPPTAGPYVFNERELAAANLEERKQEKDKTTGQSYSNMMKHIRYVLEDISRVIPTYSQEQGHELAGFVWFQGFNDVIDQTVYPKREEPGGYDEYGRLLSLLIQDVRNDLSTPNLPFVIGVIGVEGVHNAKPFHKSFRQAMEIPVHQQYMPHVAAVRTEQFWDQEIQDVDRKLSDLTKRMNRYKWNAKAKKEMTREEEKDLMDQWKREECSPSELELFDIAKSDGGYHYYGSAKFFLRAGKAFAEAMQKLEKESKTTSSL